MYGHRPAIAAFVLLAAISPRLAAQDRQRFEGTITAKTAFEPGKSSTVTFTQKWPKERIDVTRGGKKLIILYDFTTGMRTVIDPAGKQYSVVDVHARAEQFRHAVEDAGYTPVVATVEVPVTKTTRTETVAGHKCTYYTLGQTQRVDVCAAHDLGEYMADRDVDGARAMGGQPASDTLYDDLGARFAGGYFPLKIVSRANGPERVVLLVKSIQRKSIPDSMFEVPAGFTKVDSK